jgi:hypothetical protein
VLDTQTEILFDVASCITFSSILFLVTGYCTAGPAGVCYENCCRSSKDVFGIDLSASECFAVIPRLQEPVQMMMVVAC